MSYTQPLFRSENCHFCKQITTFIPTQVLLTLCIQPRHKIESVRRPLIWPLDGYECISTCLASLSLPHFRKCILFIGKQTYQPYLVIIRKPSCETFKNSSFKLYPFPVNNLQRSIFTFAYLPSGLPMKKYFSELSLSLQSQDVMQLLVKFWYWYFNIQWQNWPFSYMGLSSFEGGQWEAHKEVVSAPQSIEQMDSPFVS